jgi:stage II sporulation protein M
MIKRNVLRENISDHVKANMGLYLLVFTFFAIGIAAGAFTIKALDDVQKQTLIKYLQGFFQILTNESIDSGAVFRQSVLNNIETVFFIWILGITVIGIPITLFAIGVRGFIIGFTVGFFIDSLGWKGLFLTVLVILPQNAIIIPCLIVICAISVSFSLMIIKNRLAKRWTNNYWQKLLSYCITIFTIFLISVFGSIVEAYITPVQLDFYHHIYHRLMNNYGKNDKK